MSTSDRPVVAVNLLSVNPSNKGSRTMLTELIPRLAEVAPNYRILLVCHKGNRHLYDESFESIEVDLAEGQVMRRTVFDLFRMASLVRGRADVLVTASNVGPIRRFEPQVAMVVAHLVLPSCQRAALPERMPLLKRIYMAGPYRRYLRRVTAVVGISEFVAEGLVDELGLDRAKVRAMPLGFTPPAEGPTLVNRNNDVLFVGTLYRYKDGVSAIRAFAACRDRLPVNSRLIIVGKDHAGEAARLTALARECGVSDRVEVRGQVSAEDLEELMRSSGVLLMPSKGEGFGLPVVEAMGYGLPVIAADATALPGVAGGAAVLVPPGDVARFSEALVQVLTDPERREEMVQQGLRRSAELTWVRSAEILRDAIEDALAAG